MLSPLIPDTKHPKWIIVAKILEIIGLPRTRKIAGRLKIYDVNNFLLSIKVFFGPVLRSLPFPPGGNGEKKHKAMPRSL